MQTQAPSFSGESCVGTRVRVCVCVRARGCEVVGPVTPTAVPIFSNVLYVGSVRERERGRERERARAHVRGGGVCGCRQQCQLLHHSFQSEWCLQLNWYLRMCRGMSCRVETTRVMSCVVMSCGLNERLTRCANVYV